MSEDLIVVMRQSNTDLSGPGRNDLSLSEAVWFPAKYVESFGLTLEFLGRDSDTHGCVSMAKEDEMWGFEPHILEANRKLSRFGYAFLEIMPHSIAIEHRYPEHLKIATPQWKSEK